jgi:polyhydroxybutyrate depolymerase
LSGQRTASRASFVLLAVLTPLALAGCQTAAAAPATPELTKLPTTACNGRAIPGDSVVSIASGGTTRPVLLHLPSGFTDRSMVPLVLNMHGSGSTAAQQAGLSGMDAAADRDGFIVAYPQGAITSGSGYDWNVPGQPLFGGGAAPANAPDDVAFLATVIHTLQADLCVDASRVYATGFSGGARMASQLGCDLSGVVAAIAPVSGLRLPAPCPSTRPVPVLTFHGTADPIDPYDGSGQAYWTYSVPVAAQRWAAHDGCGPTPAQTEPATGAELTAYSGCGDATAVTLYTIVGEGHEWPGGPTLPTRDIDVLGPQSNAVNANALMWRFFSAHPLPAS